jgi:hypothetical protein
MAGADNTVVVDGQVTGEDVVRVIDPGKKGKK